MKKIIVILVAFVTVIILTVSFAMSDKVKQDKEETDLFQSHKTDFEKINDYFTETYGKSSEEICVLLDKDILQIVGLYDGEEVRISKELQTSLNSIVPAFENYDFSFIKVNEERISYCGEGYRMYVYSRDGKAPSYYYHEGDGMHPEIYELGDGWYLLTVNYR